MLSTMIVWTAFFLGAFAGGDNGGGSGGSGQTIDCVGKDSCKDDTVECGAVDTCIINCDGESSCGGNTVLDGTAAVDVAFKCSGKDSCKGNTVIFCGSGLCYLSCLEDDTACEDTTVVLGEATGFLCEGYCNRGEDIPENFEPSPDSGCDNKCTDGQICVENDNGTFECKQDPDNDDTTSSSTTSTATPTCPNDCPAGTICVEVESGAFECRQDPDANDAGNADPAAANGESGHDAVYGTEKKTGSWEEANEVKVAAIAAVGVVLAAALGVCAYRVCKKGRKSHVGVAVDDEEEDEESEAETQMVEVVGLTKSN